MISGKKGKDSKEDLSAILANKNYRNREVILQHNTTCYTSLSNPPDLLQVLDLDVILTSMATGSC
jgi:hypothetical protein